MAVKNPRVQITFEDQTAHVLAHLAKQEDKSVSCLAKELIIEALERREDMHLSELALQRDVKRSKKIQHNDAW